MKKPNFFIVGSRRCGTTALYNYLKRHPDIYMPSLKELHYFGSDLILERIKWGNNLDGYLRYFSRAKDEKMVGEASPYYLFSKNAAKEIKRFSPKAKIIINLRNPVDQIYSSYNQLLLRGIEKIPDFENALRAEKSRKNSKEQLDKVKYQLLLYCYIADYYKHIKRYLKVFGKKNVHIIIFEEFRDNTPKIYKETLNFLGVDDSFTLNFDKINTSRVKNSGEILQFPLVYRLLKIVENHKSGLNNLIPSKYFKFGDFVFNLLEAKGSSIANNKKPSQKASKYIINNLYPDIRRLEKLLDKDLSDWYKDYV